MNRQKLLALKARRYLDLDVPGLGTWRLRNMLESERVQYEDAIWKYDKRGKLNEEIYQTAKRVLIAFTSVNEAGELILAAEDNGKIEVDQAAIAEMALVDSSPINALFDAARRHCGIDRTDIEGLIKNSAAGASAGSPSS